MIYIRSRGRRGRDHMIVGVTTTYAINNYHLTSIMCLSLSVTCDRSVVFSGYSGFLQLNWSPWYNCSIVESDVKHHKPNQPIFALCDILPLV